MRWPELLRCLDIIVRRGSRDCGPSRRHARHRADRRLLHHDAARPAWTRPGGGRLLAHRRAGRGVPAALGRAAGDHEHRRRGHQSRRRRRRGRTAQPHARGGHRRRRSGRQAGAVHEAAGPLGGRGQAHPRRRGVGGRVRRLPGGPRLHPQDDQVAGCRRQRGDRRRDVGAQPRDPSRSPQRVVLGRRTGRWWMHRRPRLPLHRDHPQLRRQDEPSRRGDVLERHARPPDRGRGQRHRPRALRERGRRAVRGQLDVPRRHGPPRRGGRHRGHDLDQPLPAHRLRDVLERRGRLCRREGRDGEWVVVPRRRRGRRARLRRDVHGHVRRHRPGPRADRDVLRRLRRQRRDGRLLPLGGQPAVGADRAGVALRHDGSHRQAAPDAGAGRGGDDGDQGGAPPRRPPQGDRRRPASGEFVDRIL